MAASAIGGSRGREITKLEATKAKSDASALLRLHAGCSALCDPADTEDQVPIIDCCGTNWSLKCAITSVLFLSTIRSKCNSAPNGEQHAFMKRPAEYLEQAAKYDDLVAQATNERRKREFEKLADVYRYLAEEAALLTMFDRSNVEDTAPPGRASTNRRLKKY